MDVMIGAALIGLLGGIIATGVNAAMTEKEIEASQEQSDKNIALQKEFNATQSLSSKISEAKKNGISPLAVLGQNASNAVVSAPQGNADYSGFSRFGSSTSNSIASLFGSLSSMASTRDSNNTYKEVQRMKNENAKDIANLEIGSAEKRNLDSLNNALAIASAKNATDKEIQENIRSAQHNLEMLKSSNAEFVQDKALKNAMYILDKQLDDASKERNFKRRQLLISEAFETFRTFLKSASNVFGGNISSAVSNSERSPMGFQF